MIRKATAGDLDAVVRIYDEIHQMEEDGKATTGGIRGVYPTKAVAEEALKRDDLFVIEKDGEVLGSGIVNKIQVADYARVQWEHDADPDHVCVLHTLTISPRASRMGLGKQFVDFYEAYALENGCLELRIDTNERNLVARKMYAKRGYKEIAIVPTVFNGIPNVKMVILEKHLDLE